ncbi:MAG: hypothetical protein EKK47_22705 [Burkholderiales bacterium]|jgi:hypothetical protein|nr:MAG: hypothetical protein EKK47_22705 [Burkholderiales bacterium]
MNTKGIGACAVCIVASFTLTACGGGGGGSSDPSAQATPSNVVASTASFPVSGAVTVFEQSSWAYTLSGTDTKNNKFVMQASGVAGTTSTFEGNPSSTSVVTTNVTTNGTAGSPTTSTHYFQATPYLEFGQLDSDGSYTVDDVSTPIYLPASAKVGQSGQLNGATMYTDSTKATALAHVANSWSLEADTQNTAYLCNHSTYTATANGSGGGTIDNCLKINTSGTVIGMKYAETYSGGSLTLQTVQ